MEKRSTDTGIAQAYLFPDLGEQGVGARQEAPSPRHRGGGYLDICTAANSGKKPRRKKIGAGAHGNDPRLNELRRIGLQRVWLDIAATVGVDTFLLIWRLLDADPSTRPEGESSLRITVRSYGTYLRYQRNRYIAELAGQGKGATEIRQIVSSLLGEKLSKRHIERLMADQ